MSLAGLGTKNDCAGEDQQFNSQSVENQIAPLVEEEDLSQNTLKKPWKEEKYG
jgi:hypothetical protein